MEIDWDFTVIDFMVMLAVFFLVVSFIILRFVLHRKRVDDRLDKKFIQRRWRKIEELFNYGKEMNFKLAVIEADKLLDYVLKQMGFTGDTMAERMKVAGYRFSKVKDVWWAHKVRNHVVHDVKYILKQGETRMVLSLYKKVLKQMKVL